jgi:uncharacterized protein YacL
MASHMKTTVVIPDALLAEVQKIATKNKTTLRALMQEGLQHIVEREQKAKKQFKLKDMSVDGNGLTPEFQSAGWSKLIELSYEDRGA